MMDRLSMYFEIYINPPPDSLGEVFILSLWDCRRSKNPSGEEGIIGFGSIGLWFKLAEYK